MFGVGVFFFILVAIIGSFVAAYQQWQRSAAAWKEAAAHLGLQSATSSMFSQSSMTGSVRGVNMRVHTEQRSRGNNNKTLFTIYTADFHADGPVVSIKRERGLGLMKRLLGKTDIEVGDPAFDDALIVDAPDPEATRAFLTPSRRHAIYSLLESWPTAELSTRLVTPITNSGTYTATNGNIPTAKPPISQVRRRRSIGETVDL